MNKCVVRVNMEEKKNVKGGVNVLNKQQFKELYVKENLVVNCTSEEQANNLLSFANRFGYRWCSGHSYINNTSYLDYGKRTCYYLFDGTFTNLEYFMENNYTIIKYGAHLLTEEDKFWEKVNKIN